MYSNHVFTNINDALPVLCGEVMKGNEVGSRQGSRTMERMMVGTTLEKPWQREILLPGRKANIAAQIAETMWVLSGRNDVEFLQHYLPRAADFSDDGETWRAGYGPRLRKWEGFDKDDDNHARITAYADQLAEVVRLLREDRTTRRAVMSIFDPAVDYADSKDIPCNNWLSFISRLGKLDLHVAIRSNDLIWGWSGINAFEWSALLEIVAGLVGVEVGAIHYSTTSLHIYEQHWDKVTALADEAAVGFWEDSPQFETPEGVYPEFVKIADLDYLFAEWFRLEETIRESSEDSAQQIEDFPEPMLRSWLRVIQWWWSGDRMFLEPLAGTRLEAATRVSIQPSLATKVAVEIGLADRNLAPSDQFYDGSSDFIKFAVKTHNEKHAAYGDSWKRRGEMLGILANIARKVDRLGGAETSDETSADTAMDLMVYLAKYKTWLRDRLMATGNSAGTHDSDTPDAADKVLIKLDSKHQTGSLYDRAGLETQLRDRFDALEKLVMADSPRRATVELMLRDAYLLAKMLWDKQKWAEGNATRSWNPDRDEVDL